MARQFFDDGSWIEVDSAGTSYAANTDGIVVSKVEADGDYFRSPSYWTDARESQKIAPYVPGDSAVPWWQRVAEYGVTRAIDNHFGPAQTDKTAMGGTYAGQNGRTYSSVLGANGAPPSGGSLLPFILAGAAFLVLS